ncbi:hypothetical protein [uncultured Desulfosarcina sp.]|uniref:hypothetical protein n=1 Tax=uncultured Desulfosarcina sp. TaxID=218289 RepID=UPI0029C92D87|nr:hypothetical protein [uncultured Desulfosarcina sp.]
MIKEKEIVMNTETTGKKSRIVRFNNKILSFVAVLAVCVFTISTAAFGALEGGAGNTVIRNTVTVNYQDGGGAAQTPISAAIDVIVNTIDVPPTVVSFSPLTGSTDGTGSTQAYTVTLRTNSNGPESILLNAVDGNPTNIAISAILPSLSSGSVFLGATVIDPSEGKIGTPTTINAGATIQFAVPNDGGVPTNGSTTGGSASDNVINGLAVGDVVYIHEGTTHYGPFSITAVSDPSVGSGATAVPGNVTLHNDSGASITFTPLAGCMILEESTVTLTVTQGVVADPLIAASWETTVTASMNGQNGTALVTTNAARGSLLVSKYVRNVTNDNGTGATRTIAIDTTNYTFYNSGVNGDPGDTLEYALVIENTSLGMTQGVVAIDQVPAYTTLSTWANNGYGSTGGAAVFAAVDDGPNYAEMTVVDSDDESLTVGAANADGSAAGSAMTFYLGSEGSDSTNTGGTLAAGGTITVFYRVTID